MPLGELQSLYPAEEKDAKLLVKCQFDNNSKRIIGLAKERQKNLPSIKLNRFAIVGWIVEDKKTGEWSIDLRGRIGLPADSSQWDISTVEKSGFKNLFVVARERNLRQNQRAVGSGIVHQQVFEQVSSEEPSLQGRKIAFSLCLKNGMTVVNWLDRSAINGNTFPADPLALACLTFSPKESFNNLISFKRYYFYEQIKRRIPFALFSKIMKLCNDDLIKTFPDFKFTIDPTYLANIENMWEEIRNEKDEKEKEKKIHHALMRNIYIASSIPKTDTTKSRNNHENDIIYILKIAKKNNIKLNIDYLPKEFGHPENNTALMQAIKTGLVRTVELLLEEKANVLVKNSAGESPLTLAVKQGNSAILNMLLTKVPLEEKHSQDSYPLMKDLFLLAKNNNQLEIILSLLERNTNQLIEYIENDPMLNKLFLLSLHNHLEIAQYLLPKITHPCVDENGNTALIVALQAGNEKIAEHFLQETKEINNIINAKNKKGVSPLMVAIGNQNTKLTFLLLEKGAHISEKELEKLANQVLLKSTPSFNISKLFIELGFNFFSKENKEDYFINKLDKETRACILMQFLKKYIQAYPSSEGDLCLYKIQLAENKKNSWSKTLDETWEETRDKIAKDSSFFIKKHPKLYGWFKQNKKEEMDNIKYLTLFESWEHLYSEMAKINTKNTDLIISDSKPSHRS
ncbi:MAG: ankyrin repeat domain-containing protein [Gammaproteobacteria bacterium]|nr:ankyrin repeat domain-containing protein [Gammaproteobacteria bacterium]